MHLSQGIYKIIMVHFVCLLPCLLVLSCSWSSANIVTAFYNSLRFPPQLLYVDVGLICTSYNEDTRSTSLPLGSAQNILTQSKLFHVRKQKLVVVCELSSLLKLLYFLIRQNYMTTISGNKYCLFSNSVSFTQKQALTPGWYFSILMNRNAIIGTVVNYGSRTIINCRISWRW